MKTSNDFEVGTPVRFILNEREVSGEVVLRAGKTCVSLYPNENYAGANRLIFIPIWEKVKTLYTDNHISNINVNY